MLIFDTYFNKADIIWQDLEPQHIYDLGQKFLIRSKKPKIFYLRILSCWIP